MIRSAMAALLLCSLCACDVVSTFSDGMKQSNAVAADLEKAVGSKPFVGFNWNNGVLTSININFDGIPKDKSIADIADAARTSVKAQFKQEPQKILIAFAVDPS
jgi:hypothetical protein